MCDGTRTSPAATPEQCTVSRACDPVRTRVSTSLPQQPPSLAERPAKEADPPMGRTGGQQRVCAACVPRKRGRPESWRSCFQMERTEQCECWAVSDPKGTTWVFFSEPRPHPQLLGAHTAFLFKNGPKQSSGPSLGATHINGQWHQAWPNCFSLEDYTGPSQLQTSL